jgi:hypothetical protein
LKSWRVDLKTSQAFSSGIIGGFYFRFMLSLPAKFLEGKCITLVRRKRFFKGNRKYLFTIVGGHFATEFRGFGL